MRRFSWQNILAVLLIIAGLGLLGASYGQVVGAKVWYWLTHRGHVQYSVDKPQADNGQTKLITPVSMEYGLIIERINVNEAVKADVDATNPDIYLQALKKSNVAEAAGGVDPGQVGTTYLFGHSTINIWEIGRYHAPFTLLDEVQLGDRIVVYFKGQRYNYMVKDKKSVLPSETHYMTDPRTVPTLIVQTCDPPGENSRRLLLFAELQQ